MNGPGSTLNGDATSATAPTTAPETNIPALTIAPTIPELVSDAFKVMLPPVESTPPSDEDPEFINPSFALNFEKAARDAKTSGAPLPSARSVTPAVAGARFHRSASVLTAGQK